MTATGFVVPVASAADPTDEPCLAGVDDAATAAGMAQRCGSEVEVLGARTPWQTQTALADGSTRLDVSEAAIRTDVSGAWEPVDPSLVTSSSGIEVASAVNPMEFSDGTDSQPLATIHSGDKSMSLDVPFDLPAPSVTGSVLTYADVLADVDLIVTVDEDATGFSEVLRVDSPEAAQRVLDAGLSFPVETTGGLDVVPAGDGFAARDSAGGEVFSSPTPQMWDSAAGRAEPAGVQSLLMLSSFALAASDSGADAVPVDGAADPRAAAPQDGDQVADMAVAVGDDAVTVTPDEALLASPDTVWPVYVDPGLSGDLNEWTTIRSGASTSTALYDSKNADGEGVGVCDPAATSACTRYDVQRSAWEFNGTGMETLAGLDADDIISATFRVNGRFSWSCAGSSISEYRIPNISSGTTWDSSAAKWDDPDLSDYITRQTVVSREGCGGDDEPGLVEYDAKEAAVWAAAGNHASVTIGLRAHDETSMPNSWQRFKYDATFSFTFNRPPYTPVASGTSSPDTECVTGASRPYIRSQTPILRGIVSDPDGGTVQADFNVYRLSDDAVMSNHGLTAKQVVRAEHVYHVADGELPANGTFYWKLRGYDGSRYGPFSTTCEFTIDTVPPAAPTVSVASGPYTSSTTTPAGGIGVGGSFKFSDSSTDVDHYMYSFVDDAMGTSTSSTTGVYKPTQVGPTTLYVKAVDKAGNASTTTKFTFLVSFTKASDKWLFNESVTSPTAATETTTGRDLTVVGNPGRVAGPQDDPNGTRDRALVLKGSGAEYAQSSGPAIHTETGFAVSAMVQLSGTGTDKTRTVVSQSASKDAAFELGFRKTGCPATLPDGCWAFWRTTSDAATPTTVIAASTQPVKTDEWVQLAGSYDPTSKQIFVWVCEADEYGAYDVVKSAPTSFTSTPWPSFGNLQVGRAVAGATVANPWAGVVDKVTTWDQIAMVDEAELKRDCSGNQTS